VTPDNDRTVDAGADATRTPIDLLVAGLGPGGCAAALAAHAEGLRTLAVEARGTQATRSQLVLVRPGAQAALRQLGLPDVTEGRRTTTIRHVENRLRGTLAATAQAAAAGAAPAAAQAPLNLCWHTSVVALATCGDHVRVTLRDEATGAVRTVAAHHVIDATGGRLEALGRPARRRAGPSHLVVTAEYAAPPWFDGIVGVRDPATHELYLLFPTWGRRGVIAYFDAPPGTPVDGAAFRQRFEAIAERLALGPPRQDVAAVDVFQRVLAGPSTDRVLPIGDAVGNVDVLFGAGMSWAIEDGVDAARGVAAARRESSAQGEQAVANRASARIFARHRAGTHRGRLMLAVRPILERAWPTAALPDIGRETVGPPPLLWPAVRFVFGRRPQAS
jgi:2-polyprenyl-6-methoxyphenol hydroxylase-like FAD-dependent oxidoreductase